jgi:hypothetical protein
MPSKAEKAKETKELNKQFEAELINKPLWQWGDKLDLSKAEEVPANKVKMVLSRIIKQF